MHNPYWKMTRDELLREAQAQMDRWELEKEPISPQLLKALMQEIGG